MNNVNAREIILKMTNFGKNRSKKLFFTKKWF